MKISYKKCLNQSYMIVESDNVKYVKLEHENDSVNYTRFEHEGSNIKIEHVGFEDENSNVKIEHVGFEDENSNVKIEHVGFEDENSNVKVEHVGFEDENGNVKVEHVGFELEMIHNNAIGGILPMQVFRFDDRTEFWYDITGKQSLLSYFERIRLKADTLFLILNSLERLCHTLKLYMLEEQRVNLIEELIYINYDADQIYFTYLPFKKEDMHVGFQKFMEFILQKIDHSDEKAVTIGYETYQMSLQEGISLSQILQKIYDSLKKEQQAEEPQTVEEQFNCTEKWNKERQIRTNERANSERGNRELQHGKETKIEAEKIGFEKSKNRSQIRENHKDRIVKIKNATKAFNHIWTVMSTKFKNKLSGIKQENQGKKAMNHKEEFMPVITLEDIEKPDMESHYPTVYLGDDTQTAQGKLVYQGSGEEADIVVDRVPYILGKSKTQVDGTILHQSVSRIHARIEKIEDEYFIEDLNSTNGTFLNGKVVEYREKVRVEKNDQIVLGQVEYIFT
ncbi:FHA domain-containing protein [Lachnospiraceae bacterium ZAX-1]